ncbi:MAG: hypothetical protein AAGN35_09485 [Bacteroidota bacterium]
MMTEDHANDPQGSSAAGQPQDSDSSQAEATTEDGGLMVSVTDSFGQTGGDDGEQKDSDTHD